MTSELPLVIAPGQEREIRVRYRTHKGYAGKTIDLDIDLYYAAPDVHQLPLNFSVGVAEKDTVPP